MKKIIIPFFTILLLSFKMEAQVKTNFNNSERVTERGQFNKSYSASVFEIAPPNLENAFRRDKIEDSLSSKVFYIAEPVVVNINLLKLANWVSDEKYLYGKFTLTAKGAKTLSINFSNFFLPNGTEMFIYNKEAEMITGVVTENENNESRLWGSSIYKGDELNIEIKLPITEKENLNLLITNVAYGYKDIFISKLAGFGLSGACNINVLCPLGNGWEPERNSVVYIARSNGDALCSGAMLMNTCATNIPYVLTADHCFQGDGNVAGWRVHFQAWSATCTPNQNSDGILFNGSTLRANWQPSDFCLVQLNQTPAANSGIHYAGWTRQMNAATSGVGIHHPSGDVMKISTYGIPLVREDNPARCGINPVGQLHWVVQWNQGVTEGGSSGSPLFDENHRVVGQLSGGPSACSQPANCRLDMYGRFDNSWTGGGTNATMLSNWLDPTNTGAVTTNTTDISQITPAVNGPNAICPSGTYFISGLPNNATVTWVVSNPALASLTINGNIATVTSLVNGSSSITLDATITSACLALPVTISKFISLGAPIPYNINYTNTYNNAVNPIGFLPTITNAACARYSIITSIDAPAGSTATWQKISSTSNVSWSQNQGALNFYLWGANQNVVFQLDVSSSCGTYSRQAKWESSNCGSGGGACDAFTISPNPSTGKIKVVINNFPPPCFTQNSATANVDFKALKIAKVNVYNVAGTIINTTRANSANQASIDLGYTTSGTHFVEIICTNGYKEKQMIFINQ